MLIVSNASKAEFPTNFGKTKRVSISTWKIEFPTSPTAHSSQPCKEGHSSLASSAAKFTVVLPLGMSMASIACCIVARTNSKEETSSTLAKRYDRLILVSCEW